MSAQGTGDKHRNLDNEERRVLAEYHFRQEGEAQIEKLRRRGSWKQRMIIRICVVLVCAFIVHVGSQIRRVHRLQDRYQLVQPGMDSAAVFATMSESTVEILYRGRHDEEMEGWWDETPLGATDQARIETAECYTVHTLFKTVRWIFTLDKNGKVVGKHRF